MSNDKIQILESSNYMSFSTRKKSGDFVATPVWFAPHNGSYYVFSAGEAGKVKRLRNFSESRIAACTMRGAVTGPWVETSAHLLTTKKDQDKALSALRSKYGLQMLIGDVFSKLTGKMGRRAYIRVDVAK